MSLHIDLAREVCLKCFSELSFDPQGNFLCKVKSETILRNIDRLVPSDIDQGQMAGLALRQWTAQWVLEGCPRQDRNVRILRQVYIVLLAWSLLYAFVTGVR